MSGPTPERVVAIVQARMGSTRLPGKVLLPIAGKSMLERVVARLRRARLLEAILVATTRAPADEAVAGAARRLGVPAFRGAEDDVLDRYHEAARTLGARVIVRITADCPLIDAGIVDQVVGVFLDERPDYASNTLVRTYPTGLDTEVFSAEALHAAWREARAPYQRAHVTPFLYEHPERFRLRSVADSADRSGMRWTVDTAEDLSFVREVYSRFAGRDDFSWSEVAGLLEREPALADVNRHVRQKPLTEG